MARHRRGQPTTCQLAGVTHADGSTPTTTEVVVGESRREDTPLSGPYVRHQRIYRIWRCTECGHVREH